MANVLATGLTLATATAAEHLCHDKKEGGERGVGVEVWGGMIVLMMMMMMNREEDRNKERVVG